MLGVRYVGEITVAAWLGEDDGAEPFAIAIVLSVAAPFDNGQINGAPHA